MKELAFDSTEDFYDFISLLSYNLNETGFPDCGLKEILRRKARTSTFEVLEEIKNALLEIKITYTDTLPPCISEDINSGLKAIDRGFKP